MFSVICVLLALCISIQVVTFLLVPSSRIPPVGTKPKIYRPCWNLFALTCKVMTVVYLSDKTPRILSVNGLFVNRAEDNLTLGKVVGRSVA